MGVMRAAVVTDTNQPPTYTDFADPVVAEGRVEAEVLASAVHVIVRTIAAGQHYSSTTKPPFVPGLDGVVRLPDGRRVYAAGVQAPYGMLAERAAVPANAAVEVPEGLSSATAAALVNPAASSWVPLSRLGAEGATVLVVGATGTSGLLAVQTARALGARASSPSAATRRGWPGPPRSEPTRPSRSGTTSPPRWPRRPGRTARTTSSSTTSGASPRPPCCRPS